MPLISHVVGPTVTVNDLRAFLTAFGFSLVKGIETALQNYQEFHGLPITGDPDNHTIRSMNSHRYCGHADIMQLTNSSCKWPKNQITWGQVASIGNIPDADVINAASLALSFWSQVANLSFTNVSNNAMIQIGSRNIDNAGGVLAESELPCGNVSVCHQWYDNGEHWVIADKPQMGQIDLVRVMCHELGHALGLPHIGAGNLMAPIYSPVIRQPQSGDIQEIQARYGPPNPNPNPNPNPPSDSITIKITGSVIEIPGYRVTKLG